MKKALFLDRDGVVCVEKEYLFRISDFEFLDGVFEACQYFQGMDYHIFIITNQSGICRGYYTEKDYLRLTQWMVEQFDIKNIKIDKVYYCPHHPDLTGRCYCRKPDPGMIVCASEEFGVDLGTSILVGDKISDIKAGLNAGVGSNYLISTGHVINDDMASLATGIINDLTELTDKY